MPGQIRLADIKSVVFGTLGIVSLHVASLEYDEGAESFYCGIWAGKSSLWFLSGRLVSSGYLVLWLLTFRSEFRPNHSFLALLLSKISMVPR